MSRTPGTASSKKSEDVRVSKEEVYRERCKLAKRKCAELEEQNNRLLKNVKKAKCLITRLRLERSFLFDKLDQFEDASKTTAASLDKANSSAAAKNKSATSTSKAAASGGMSASTKGRPSETDASKNRPAGNETPTAPGHHHPTSKVPKPEPEAHAGHMHGGAHELSSPPQPAASAHHHDGSESHAHHHQPAHHNQHPPAAPPAPAPKDDELSSSGAESEGSDSEGEGSGVDGESSGADDEEVQSASRPPPPAPKASAGQQPRSKAGHASRDHSKEAAAALQQYIEQRRPAMLAADPTLSTDAVVLLATKEWMRLSQDDKLMYFG